MFSRISRYRKLPDVVTADSEGRAVASTSLRLLPDVEGRFLHTVEDGDRLDHLAYKYYKQPRDWWRIMDANAAFLAPDSLLGKQSLTTAKIPVAWTGPVPPWSDLLRDVRRVVGVERAILGSSRRPTPDLGVVEGPTAFDIAPAHVADLDESGRTQKLAPALAAALLAEGVTFSTDLRIAKPDATTWRITDTEDRSVYTFRHFPAESLLNVHTSAFRFDWLLMVTYEHLTTTAAALLSTIETRGFTAGVPSQVHRVGKAAVIPPRTV